MTYTLAMAADQHIQIADDGVAEVPMTHARAALTSLIRDVSWGGRFGAFTERGKRVAVVVPTERFQDVAVLGELRAYLAEVEAGDRPSDKTKARTIREALEIAERRADDSG